MSAATLAPYEVRLLKRRGAEDLLRDYRGHCSLRHVGKCVSCPACDWIPQTALQKAQWLAKMAADMAKAAAE